MGGCGKPSSERIATTPAASRSPFVYATGSARSAASLAAVTASRVGSHPRCDASHRRSAIPNTVESVNPSATDHRSSWTREDEWNDSPRNIIRVSKPSGAFARRSSSR
jgi:hypothetical protein